MKLFMNDRLKKAKSNGGFQKVRPHRRFRVFSMVLEPTPIGETCHSNLRLQLGYPCREDDCKLSKASFIEGTFVHSEGG